MKDMVHSLDLKDTILPQVAKASINGAAVDLQGADKAALIVAVGASGDTLSDTVKLAVAIQESDDGTTFTAAPAEAIQNATPDSDNNVLVIAAAAAASQSYRFGYVGEKRYIRAVLTATGTHTNGMPVAAVVVRAPLLRGL